MDDDTLENLLDRLVAEYSDRLSRGDFPRHEDYLSRVPDDQRQALARCLNVLDAGLVNAPSTRLLEPGSTLGDFRVERLLGSGGMATVYLAEEISLKRPVALKVLRPGLAVDRRQIDRFRREAMAIARIRHPHILQIYSVGEESGQHYIAMEYVDGPNLAEVFERLPRGRRREPGDLAEASGIPALAAGVPTYERAVARLLAQVARAVAVAHELGIVHRDIKPSNILIHHDGRAVIADFGLAKAAGNVALSLTGELLGTPCYMSPEQVLQAENQVDERTDIYSLGVTIYEGLSGRRPFDGPTVLAVLDAIRTGTPPSLRSAAPGTSRDAHALVRKAMSRDPTARYSTAMDLAADLEQLALGQTTRARALEGGLLRRALAGLERAFNGQPVDYRSAATFLGLPLVHIHYGQRARGEPMRVAKGWLAIGHIAVGGIAIGNGMAAGGIALGGAFAVGLVSLGGAIAAGIAASAGALAAGLVAVGGGGAVGYLAIAGGIAVGYGAIAGGIAWGHYAFGATASGAHVITRTVEDPAAREWFATRVGWLIEFLEGLRER